MSAIGNQVFSRTDAVLEESLRHRTARQDVGVSNLANAYTPGYRALGYEFETQLRAAIGNSDALLMRTSDAQHVRNPGVSRDGNLKPDLFVKPTESIGNDGNSVDVDQEMSDLAANQIMYKATVEILNRRIGMMRYGINGGR